MHQVKLDNLILYIASSPRVKDLGKTKLYKLIYFCDVRNLREHGETITSSDFIKYKHGPVPSRAEKRLKALKRDDKISVELKTKGGHKLHEVKALVSPDCTVFSDEELENIKFVCADLGKKTAVSLSSLSHEEPSWVFAKMGKSLSSDLMLYGASEEAEGL